MSRNEETVNEYKVGDLVEWTSQARMYAKWKRGRVLIVLQPGDLPDKVAGAIWRFNDGWRENIWPLAQKGEPSEYNWGALGGGTSGRHKVSYLVQVPSTGRGKAKLYWPRTSQLRLVSQ